MLKYSFGGDTGMSPDEIKRKREFAKLLMDKNLLQPKNVPEGLNAIARALVSRGTNRMTDKAETANRDAFREKFGSLFGGGSAYGGGAGGNYTAPPQDPADRLGLSMGSTEKPQRREGVMVDGQNYALGEEAPDSPWAGLEDVQQGIFAGESGGDYDALFGFSNREGGAFQGVKPTEMTVGQIAQFTDPSGQYGQWVKGKVGRVATPVGAYQVVGTTLRDAINNGVVSPDEQFTPAVQDRVGRWVHDTQGTGAWEGYRGPRKGGSGGGTQVAQAGKFDMGTLADLASSPYATEGQKVVLGALLERQMNASDPMYRLDLERAQLENQALRNPQPDLTSSQREYEMAKSQGYQGTLMDYKRDLAEAQRAQNNVTVNTGDDGAPRPELLGTSGLVAIPDPSVPEGYRVVPAPGSPLAKEQEDAAATEERREGNRGTETSIVTTAAQRAREAAQGRAVGGILGGVASNNPSSTNAELYRQVDVLRSQAQLGNLQAMREASKTGGALGSVTEKELQILADKSGALNPASPNFLRDLDDYERTLLRTIHGPEEGDRIFEATRAAPAQPGGKPAPPTPDEVKNLSDEELLRRLQGSQ